MATEAPSWLELDDPDLLVADVPWESFLPALRETSGETFQVGESIRDDWLDWLLEQEPGGGWRTWRLLGGDLDGRSYLLGLNVGPGATMDQATLLAADTDGLVLGMTYQDITGGGELVAARGDTLLRFVLESNWGDHQEGEPLPGETEGRLPTSPSDFQAVLSALGFDPDGWLQRGRVWRVLWTTLDPQEQPEAHQRLYFGALRMRVDHIERAALEEMEGE